MVERKWAGHALAALAGVVLFVIFVGWIGSAFDGMTIRDCDAMGVTMLKGEPYRCERMEVPRD